MLAINAWHAQSDLALILDLIILRMDWRFAFDTFNDLMDQRVDDEAESKIS